jgi:hypothetical protein
MEGQLTHYNNQTDMITASALDSNAIIKQVSLIQNIMKNVMKENEHFGKIPGCGDKPTLLKAGAEKLNFTFRLTPEFDITETALQNGHIKIDCKCKLLSLATNQKVGEGIGSCSTLEGKFRYRTGPVEFTGQPVPKKYWDLKKDDFAKALESIGGKGHIAKKNPDTGQWEIAIQGEKVEHDNPADYYNTVYKMSKKRAYVDATITALAASDIFTQDIEELVENGAITPATSPEPIKQAQTSSPAKQTASKPPKEAPNKPNVSDAEIIEERNTKSVFEAAKEELKNNDWNGKVYANNVIYINKKKFQLTKDDIDKLTEINNKS